MIELSYFNPIRHAVVDPMHNLYIGVAKHSLEVWIDQGILTKKDFDVIEQRISKILTPRDVGRIPLKIVSGFSGFTADQWRNWTNIFSPVALKGLLPNNHLACWLLFVRASSLLSTRIISTAAINDAHQFLVAFSKQFCLLYGKDACTPNMHMSLHLKQCLEDYGPLHSFWCYAFERCNGKYHTNNQSIESQIMKKFLRDQQTCSLERPPEAVDLFSSVEVRSSGSLLESESENNEYIFKLRTLAECDNINSDYAVNSSSLISMLPPLYSGSFTVSEMQQIQAVYNHIYNHETIVHVSHFYEASKKCEMAGEYFTSVHIKERSSLIMAYWPVEVLTSLSRELQVGHILRFLKHNIKIKNGSNQIVTKTHILCQVEWCIQHEEKNWYGVSATVCTLMKHAINSCSFLPVQRIACRCAHGQQDIIIPPNHCYEKVLVAIPICLKYSF